MEAGVYSSILLILVVTSLTLGTQSKRRFKETFKQHNRPPGSKPLPQRSSHRRGTNPHPLFSNEDLDFVIAPQHHQQFPELVKGIDSDSGSISRVMHKIILGSFHDHHTLDSSAIADDIVKEKRVPAHKEYVAPHNVQIHVIKVPANVRDIPLGEHELNAPPARERRQTYKTKDSYQDVKGINQVQETRTIPYSTEISSVYKRPQPIRNVQNNNIFSHNRVDKNNFTSGAHKAEVVGYNQPQNKDKERLSHATTNENTRNTDYHSTQQYSSSDGHQSQPSDKANQTDDLFNGNNLTYPDDDLTKGSSVAKKQSPQISSTAQSKLNKNNLDHSRWNSDNSDTYYLHPNSPGQSSLYQNQLDYLQLDPNNLDTSYFVDDYNMDHKNSGYPKLNSNNLYNYLGPNKFRRSKLDHNGLDYSHLDSDNLRQLQLNPNTLDHSDLNRNDLGYPQVDTNNLEPFIKNPNFLDHSYLNPNNVENFHSEKHKQDNSHTQNFQPELDPINSDDSYLNPYNIEHSYLNPNNIKYPQIGPTNLDHSSLGQHIQEKSKTNVNSYHTIKGRKKHHFGQDYQTPQSLSAVRYTTDLTEPKCQMEFYFDFLNNWKERSGKIWMDNTGNVKAVDGQAKFFGSPRSYLSIPFFSGNDLRPHYRLSLVVESDEASGLPVTVVSNAKFRPATFGIYIVQRGIYVAVVPRRDTQNSYLSTPVVVGLPLDTTGPNHVIVDHDDKTQDLWLKVNGKSVHAVARMPIVSSEPLYIGAGSSPVQPTEPLSGSVSSLSFHKCPRKSNKR